MAAITANSSVLIRAARGSDGPALHRLAELDSRPLPTGELLVAEADVELVAALSIESGAGVADPFRPTADVVDLLAMRAQRLRAASAPRAHGRRVLAPRARAA